MQTVEAKKKLDAEWRAAEQPAVPKVGQQPKPAAFSKPVFFGKAKPDDQSASYECCRWC